jgi:hypothetical protein
MTSRKSSTRKSSLNSTSTGCGVSRVVALPVGEKTFGVDTVEGIVIRVGDEFGLRTQTLMTAAIYHFSSYNMLGKIT